MSLIISDNWKPDGVDDLEPNAWTALREIQRSVLVTAGAGAGKTEFLAQKAAYLLQTGLCPAPKRILAISFKRDASHNLEDRVRKRCSPEQSRRFSSYTFDAFAKSLVDRFRAAIPAPWSPPSDYQILMPKDRDYEPFLERSKVNRENIENLKRAIAGVGNGTDEEISSAAEKYWHAQYKHKPVLLSFPMIGCLAGFLIKNNPLVLKALRLTYPVVFLDEFQDTTEAQFRLLCSAFDDGRTIFTAVGDDKQRIMEWAGAMPDAFARFEEKFKAQRISLISNYRSHADLVRIQHAIACRIDSNVTPPKACGELSVEGDIAAIWEFENQDEEGECLARWIHTEVQKGVLNTHDIAILARMRVNDVENKLSQPFGACGLKLRNVAREVGHIAIQDLLCEDLTQILLPLLRLGAMERSPENWNTSLQNMNFLEEINPDDEPAQQRLLQRLGNFVDKMRMKFLKLNVTPRTTTEFEREAFDFVGEEVLRRSFPAYRRQSDFERVKNGFTLLLKECAGSAETWSEVLDAFEGLGQIQLMTIHTSKGLEFHTMIFYGLDNKTWWRLEPCRTEELNAFFVAFTRAKQRAFFTLCTQSGGPVEWIEELLASVGVQRIKGCS